MLPGLVPSTFSKKYFGAFWGLWQGEGGWQLVRYLFNGGAPNPHLKPGHLEMEFFGARCLLDGAFFV